MSDDYYFVEFGFFEISLVIVKFNCFADNDQLNRFDENSDISTYLGKFNCHYETEPQSWKFCCHAFYSVLKILEVVDLDSKDVENLLGDIDSIISVLHKCCETGLKNIVKRQDDRVTFNTTDQSDVEYCRLLSCLRIFNKLFQVNLLNSNVHFDDGKLDYFIGVLSVIALKKSGNNVTEFRSFMMESKIVTLELRFKYLMMCKGFKGLSKEFQLLAHQELMRMIRSKNGVLLLCKNLLVNNNGEAPTWQRHAMISRIIESAITKKSQNFLIEEIFHTIEVSHNNGDLQVMAACVQIIKHLLEKNNEELKILIVNKIFNKVSELSEPEILLCGSILMENQEIKKEIYKLNIFFSTSSASSLPSTILDDFIFLIFDLYAVLPHDNECKKLLRDVLIFHLINREKDALLEVIHILRLKDDKRKLRLHSRIIYTDNRLQIGSDQKGLTDDTDEFVDLIRNSNNNFLIFDVFHSLVKIFGGIQNSSDKFLSEYDVDEENLPEVLHRKFFKKLAILEPLQEMIQWKSLQMQLNEKPKEIADAVKDILIKAVQSNCSFDEQIFTIFLALFRELVNRTSNEDEKKQMQVDIEGIKSKCKSSKLRDQIDVMFSETEESINIDPKDFKFNDAMELMNNREVYMKVYGIDTLVKLVKKRDQQTVMNRHVILAAALQHLKEQESYAFLNIIRLLVALSSLMESEVVDALISEYKNRELEIDERLKFGEVIVKVNENMGELAMNFKQQLIQCFLSGSRDENNEFRTSSLVNLGNICRILSYQIHNFFYEMFQQIEGIVKSDDYLPSKRAASMLLSQILSNLPNLMDFQEYLLPIYHLLKQILANENDQQTRIHAETALDYLNSKTKEFLNPQLKPEKEIKIRLDENPHEIKEIKFK